MCSSPITIKNPRGTFIPYVDKKYFRVPCGKCLECRNRKRNELYLLSYFEYLNSRYRGGFTQFFTLTYNDDHLPVFGGRVCFDREDVKNYFKRVTSACKREFGKSFKIRRLITCEYGTLNKRPHYHFLVFVQSPCNHFKFRQILKKEWPYGFSFGSWDNFGEVNRPNGIRYVTKYVCKDVYDSDFEEDWLNSLDDVEHGVPYSLYVNAKKHCSFTLHSKKFGFCALDHILKDKTYIPKEFLTDYETILKTGCIVAPCGPNGVPTKVPLPRSLYRKLFFYSTYRYKRVTKRDIARCVRNGTSVPKHKVQQFYIPNIHYRERYPYEISNKVTAAKNQLSLFVGDNNNGLALSSILRPPYSSFDCSSTMSNNELLDKLLDIKCNRDPIFERDPFDGSFYYKRAPLEKINYPDIRDKLFSLYNFEDSAKLRLLDKAIYEDSIVNMKKGKFIEKTYRDNKILCA